jgi:hypothetical protein
MGIENPLDKPVVLFSMNAGALTTILGLGKLTDFDSYFNVPFALGCFMAGAVASLFHLYYRQLADDDFAKMVGFDDLMPGDPTPQRRVGAAILVGFITLAMIAVIAVTGVKTSRDSASLQESVAKIEAAATKDELARDKAKQASDEAILAASKALTEEARLNYVRDVKINDYRTALRAAAAARAQADATKARAEKAARTAATRLVNLAAASLLLGLIAAPLCLVLVAATPRRAMRVERVVRGLCGGAALLSLMIFVLGLSVGSVPGITAGLSTGAAAIYDVAEVPPGPAGAVLIANARDGRDGVNGRDGEAGPQGAAGLQGVQGIPGATDATVDPRIPVVIVYQGPPGKDGVPGSPGAPGKDGREVVVSRPPDAPAPTPVFVPVPGPQGLPGPIGSTGPKGDTGDIRKCWLGRFYCSPEPRPATRPTPTPTPAAN